MPVFMGEKEEPELALEDIRLAHKHIRNHINYLGQDVDPEAELDPEIIFYMQVFNALSHIIDMMDPPQGTTWPKDEEGADKVVDLATWRRRHA